MTLLAASCHSLAHSLTRCCVLAPSSLRREGARRLTRKSPLRWGACTTPRAPRWPAATRTGTSRSTTWRPRSTSSPLLDTASPSGGSASRRTETPSSQVSRSRAARGHRHGARPPSALPSRKMAQRDAILWSNDQRRPSSLHSPSLLSSSFR